MCSPIYKVLLKFFQLLHCFSTCTLKLINFDLSYFSGEFLLEFFFGVIKAIRIVVYLLLAICLNDANIIAHIFHFIRNSLKIKSITLPYIYICIMYILISIFSHDHVFYNYVNIIRSHKLQAYDLTDIVFDMHIMQVLIHVTV